VASHPANTLLSVSTCAVQLLAPTTVSSTNSNAAVPEQANPPMLAAGTTMFDKIRRIEPMVAMRGIVHVRWGGRHTKEPG
jgi:hypothetical protein